MTATTTPDRPLSRAERSRRTDQLAWRAHDASDQSVRRRLLDEMVEINVRVARAVAGRYRNRGVQLEDLEQAACLGLVKAVRRFDPTRHHDLLDYAVPTIRGEVLRYFRDLGWQLRPPRRVQELQQRINAAVGELGRQLARAPGPAEVCAELGVDRRAYDEAVQAFSCFRPTSLDRPVDGADDLTLGDALAHDADTDSAVEARVMLAPLLRRMSERDRRILVLRFVQDRTQREIGDELGVSQMQISRSLVRILGEARAELEPSTDAAAPGRRPRTEAR
jgi:RNA polymerase sigma-B factor